MSSICNGMFVIKCSGYRLVNERGFRVSCVSVYWGFARIVCHCACSDLEMGCTVVVEIRASEHSMYVWLFVPVSWSIS